MIFLFTDFGAEGPYLGQVRAVLHAEAPEIPVIDLVSNAPRGDPEASAYLLAALTDYLPADCIVLGVVDPGVGGERNPIAVEVGRRWLVGPDNGLFHGVAVRSERVSWHVIDWRPPKLSASFHGRDLFAPIAARIARRDFSWARHEVSAPSANDWPADCDRIVYFDVYGNAYTGRRWDARVNRKSLQVNGRILNAATTFCGVPEGTAFWYRNSIDLVEIAVNRGSARELLELEIGMPLRWVD